MPQILTKPRSHKLDDILNAVSLNNVLYDVFIGDVTTQSLIYVLFTILIVYEYLVTQIKAVASNIEPKDRQAVLKVPALHSASFLIDIYFFVNLSPSFAFCTFAEHLLDKHFHYNIALEIPSLDYKTCNKKLSSILYVDTFFPLEQRCMPWTWFISLEMQFFIVTCLVLLLAEIYSTYAIIIAVATFVISILASIVWESDPSTNIGEFSISTYMQFEITEFHLVFDNICLRISPYILGVCVGYILQRTQSNMKINIVLLVCGWLAYLLMFGLFIFGYIYGYEMLLPNISAGRWCQAILFTISHAMWSLMLLWTTLTAETHQTWKPLSFLLAGRYLHVLERLSPVCLLVAPIVIRLLVFTAETPIYSSLGQTFAIFVGCLVVTYISAFLFHVLFDGPLCAILQETILK